MWDHRAMNNRFSHSYTGTPNSLVMWDHRAMNNTFVHCGVVAHQLEHYEVAMSSAAHMHVAIPHTAAVVGEECK